MSAIEPLDRLMALPCGGAGMGIRLATTLCEASASIARLDQALASHPLRPALLYRARLEAVRRQAAVDGTLIDPWHLAAVIEGLRFRMDPYLRIIDRAMIIDAARNALTLHQWLVEPDFDQEGDIQRAESVLAAQPDELPSLLAAAQGFQAWIDKGEGRAPIRVALVRFWQRRRLTTLPVPLTGAAALQAGQSWVPDSWIPAFLQALEREASDGLNLLLTLERAWFAARHAIGGRRRDSHAAAGVDVLAATPLISATTLASTLGIAIKNALRMLEEFCALEIAIEVTHRSKRRLFGLAGLAPLRDVVRPPYRPEPNRGPGRPRLDVIPDDPEMPTAPPALPPLSPIERRSVDYTALEEAMAHADDVLRRTRQKLNVRKEGDWDGHGNSESD